MKRSQFNCQSCDKREHCTEICLRLKKYLENTLPQRKRVELPIGTPKYPGTSVLNYIMQCDDFLNTEAQHEIWGSISPVKIKRTSARERALLTLDLIGFPRQQIAKLFGIKVESVRRMVFATKKKLGLRSTVS